MPGLVSSRTIAYIPPPVRMNHLTQISLGTAVLVIFLTCFLFVVLRGIVRAAVVTLMLAIAAASAFLVWQRAPAISAALFGRADSFFAKALPIAIFLIVLIFLAWLRRNLALSGRATDATQSTRVFSVSRLVVSLLPTLLICLISAAVIRHAGSIAEIRGTSSGVPGFFRQLKENIAFIPSGALRLLDPSSDPARVSLAKIIAARAASPPLPEIDPTSGKPIPRAIIVDDPELQDLARSGDFSTLLRHPLLERTLSDPNLRRLGIEN